MYSRSDILNNIERINNILTTDDFSELINIISTSNIKIDNIFSVYSQYYIDFSDNYYVTQTIFHIIKNKFYYNGILEKAFCKIQSYNDTEKFKIITEQKNYTVFALDINLSNTYKNITNNDIYHILHNKYPKREIPEIMPINTVHQDITSSMYNDPLTITSTGSGFNKEAEMERQNLFDLQGYLYFLPSDNSSSGIAYEHINNTCTKFPGNIIHKMKPHISSSDTRRISILFVCKNL
jgi:hypothetical protein